MEWKGGDVMRMTKKRIEEILTKVSYLLEMDPGEFDAYRFEHISKTPQRNDWYNLFQSQRLYCKMWVDSIIREL